MSATIIYTALVLFFLLAGVWSVMTLSLLQAAIGLAITSALLTLLLFVLEAPLAGVFELSVCAGLITVVFIGTISLTRPLAKQEIQARNRLRLRRFFGLPILIAALGWVLYALAPHLDLPQPPSAPAMDVRQMLWDWRRLDLVGHILIILTGIFGVVILFMTRGAAASKPSADQEKGP